MSFEQHWALERRPWSEVIAAVRNVADRHALRFWAHSEQDAMRLSVELPVDHAAEIAADLSDLYTVEEAASELDELEGDIDFEAARAAGATIQHGVITQIVPEREDEFRRPAPDRYICTFDIHWGRDAALVVYSNEADNRAGWPAIIAFADSVATALGGTWVER